MADELVEPLLSAGYPRIEHITEDVAKTDARSTVERYDHSDDSALWRKRIHASADPGRPTNVHIRVDGWPNQQFALLFVDWLTANPDVRADYLAVKRDAEKQRRRRHHALRRRQGAVVSRRLPAGLGVGRLHRMAARAGRLAGQRRAALQRTVVGVGISRCRPDGLVELRENVVVHVDLTVHIRRIGPAKHDPHACLLRIR